VASKLHPNPFNLSVVGALGEQAGGGIAMVWLLVPCDAAMFVAMFVAVLLPQRIWYPA
jgi:hypothetical protein